MKNNDGALSFDAYINNTDFKRQASEIERSIKGISTTAENETGRMDRSFKRLGVGIGAYFSFQALKGFTTELFNVRGEFEQLEVSFTTMLRSKQKADALLQDVVKFASTTPFQLTDTAKATKQLLAYGSAAEDITDELRMLGDVASGVSAPIGDLTYLYGTLRTQGRAYTRDILQFTSRGIPVIAELARVLGVAESEVQSMVEAGKVGFPEVQQAFRNMTDEGGMFNNLMEAQSKTLKGQYSNLVDNIEVAMNDLGKTMSGTFQGAIDISNKLVENYDKVGKVLISLVATYGAYKAAVIALAAAKRIDGAITARAIALQKLELLQGRALTLEQSRRIVSSRLLTLSNIKLAASQLKLNLAVLANPYIAAGAALVGLGTALYLFSQRATAAERAQKSFNKAFEKQQQTLQDEADEVNRLVSVLKDQTTTLLQREQAYRKIIEIMPEVFAMYTKEQLMLMETDKIRALTNQGVDIKNISQLQNDYDSIIKKVNELKKTLKEDGLGTTTAEQTRYFILEDDLRKLQLQAEATLSKIKELNALELEANTTDDQRIKQLEEQRKALQAQIKDLTDIQLQIKNIEDDWTGLSSLFRQKQLTGLVKELQGVDKQLSELTKGTSTTTVADRISELNKLVKEQEKALKGLRAGDAVADKVKIEEVLSQIKLYNDELDLLGQKEILPFGSLAYWEDVIKKADEAFSMTPASNEKELEKQLKIKIEAEKKAEEIKAKFEKQSLDQILNYKRDQFIQYNRWVEYYGKESADKQFADLLKSGKGYADFLTNQINDLEKKMKSGKLSVDEAKNLTSFQSQLKEAKGEKTAIEKFTEDLDKAKESTVTLTDYIKQLQIEQLKLSGDESDFGIEKQKEISDRLKDTEKERADNLKLFLAEYKTTKERELQVEQHYNDLRIELEEQAKAGKVDNYEEALRLINEAEAQNLQETRMRLLEHSKYYEKLFGDIASYGVKSLTELRDQTKKILSTAQEKEDSTGRYYLVEIESINEEGEVVKEVVRKSIDEFNRFKEQLNVLNGAIRNKNPFTAVANSFKDLKDAIDSDGDINEAINEFDAAMTDSMATVREWANIFGEGSEEILNNLHQLLSGVKDVGVGFAKIASGDIVGGIGQTVNGIISVVNVFSNHNKKIREENLEIQRRVNELQSQYNLLLNEQIRLQKSAYDSAFVTDWSNQLVSAYEAINDAQRNFDESLKISRVWGPLGFSTTDVGDWTEKGLGKKFTIEVDTVNLEKFLETLQVKTGTKRSGFLGLESTDTFDSLLKLYPDLLKNGKLNVEYAQQLVDTIGQDMPDASKEALNGLIEWTNQIQAAQEQIAGVISQIAGSLGDDLRNSLVDAFRSGESAAEAFGSSVEKIMEDILSQMVFSTVFGEAFAQLEERMKGSFAPGGDNSFVDDFGSFFGQMPELISNFNKEMENAQKEGQKYGFDLFKSSGTDTADKSLSGAIKGMSEETAGVLAGQFNAIRITNAMVEENTRAALTHLSEIASNTRYNKHLESIDRKLDKLEADPLRGIGG